MEYQVNFVPYFSQPLNQNKITCSYLISWLRCGLIFITLSQISAMCVQLILKIYNLEKVLCYFTRLSVICKPSSAPLSCSIIIVYIYPSVEFF